MLGFDERIAHLAGGSWVLALVIALLLGLRHATDPDHLTAVSLLVAGEERSGAHGAGRLGVAWGLGHATTLAAFGLPIVLFGAYLPGFVQRSAEVAVGVVIVAFALRLLLRWRRACQRIAHHDPPRRTARAAFGIGMVHGAGGSAGVALLIVAGVAGDAGLAALCLAILAVGATVSMTLLSSTFGYVLARGLLLRSVAAAMPALGLAGVLFGTAYALAALTAPPYLL
jgi:hypothetical protein